jgi:hypothetical protein
MPITRTRGGKGTAETKSLGKARVYARTARRVQRYSHKQAAPAAGVLLFALRKAAMSPLSPLRSTAKLCSLPAHSLYFQLFRQENHDPTWA